MGRGSWTRLILATLARVLLLVVGGLLVWATVPALLGWSPTVVMSGSMEPRVHPGDIAVVRPVEPSTLLLGQVLLVDDPDRAGLLRLHRLVATHPDGTLILRGDANHANDSTPVLRENVRGVAVLRVPFVGTPVVDVADGRYVRFGAVLVAGVLLLGLATLDKRITEPVPDDSPTEPLAPIRRRTGRGAPLLIFLGCCLAAAPGPYPQVYAAFSATTSAPGNTWTASTLAAPTGVALGTPTCTSASEAQVPVSWSAVVGAASYRVRIDYTVAFTNPTTTTSAGTSTTVTATSVTATSVTTQRTIYVQVRAENGSWSSPYSTTVSRTVGPCTVGCSAPGNQTLTAVADVWITEATPTQNNGNAATPFVQSGSSSGNRYAGSNNGFVLRDQTENTTSLQLQNYRSREAGSTPPQLVITFG